MDYEFNMIGERIKFYREKNGLSQEELGSIINVSNRHLSRVETGTKNPSLALILSIANALDVTANDLLFDYLTEMSKSLGSEVYDLMYDCTPAEKAILMDMLRHMKKLLQENGI